jgi:hypothetical protein
MKKLSALCIAAALALTASTSAQADWGRHGGHRGHGHHHHHGGSGWVGPAAVLAITGLAIGAAVASQNNYYAPAPVYSAPPRPMPPVGYDTWYYCGSSGQYYPYTDACPEGWQAVPAR